jgi:ribosomal protein L15
MGDFSGIGAVWLQGVSEAFKVVLGEGWHRKTGKNGGAGNAGKEGL